MNLTTVTPGGSSSNPQLRILEKPGSSIIFQRLTERLQSLHQKCETSTKVALQQLSYQ